MLSPAAVYAGGCADNLHRVRKCTLSSTRITESNLLVRPEYWRDRNACDRFTYLEVLEESVAANTTSAARRIAGPNLRGDTKLIAGLRASVASASDDDGWANLAVVGNLIRKQQPDFDSRNWGYAKLSDLVRATELFTIGPAPTGGLRIKAAKRGAK